MRRNESIENFRRVYGKVNWRFLKKEMFGYYDNSSSIPDIDENEDISSDFILVYSYPGQTEPLMAISD